jgi:hypothetical protein
VAAQVKALRGSLKLRRGLLSYEYDLAAETKTEVEKALIPVTNKAKGFATVPKGLSSWFKQSNGSFPSANLGDIRQGIRSSSDPSRPNRKGWVSLARVENQTAAGAIFETAGRKNKDGRAPFQLTRGAIYGTYGTEGRYRKQVRGKVKGYNSNNPFAGYHFTHAIQAASPLTQNPQLIRGRKGTGRLIFRAWKQNNGVANAAVIKAIEKTTQNFYRRTDK